jgi:EAL domain-containing protein (putative c-di-GMP-specific phosphodiesterase class I)
MDSGMDIRVQPVPADLADGLHAVYQPIVALGSGAVIGFEALARGRAGTEWSSPTAMFAAARALGVAERLDRLCQEAALEGIRHAGLPPGTALFVNVVPTTTPPARSRRLSELVAWAASEHRVIVEITEDRLADDPAAVVATVERARRYGFLVALDDVGVNPASVAYLPLVSPDIIKLDRSILRDPLRPEAVHAVHAALDESERTGALILAEGVEYSHDVATAHAIGAHLAQGYLFGRPGAPGAVDAPGALAERHYGEHPSSTPFHVLAATVPTRIGSPRYVEARRAHIEDIARRVGGKIVLTSFDRDRCDVDAQRRLTALSATSPPVVAVGPDVPDHLRAAGVRVIRTRHPALAREHGTIILGPHFAAAVIARNRTDDEVEFVATTNRDAVIDCARSLLPRLVADIGPSLQLDPSPRLGITPPGTGVYDDVRKACRAFLVDGGPAPLTQQQAALTALRHADPFLRALIDQLWEWLVDDDAVELVSLLDVAIERAARGASAPRCAAALEM